MISLKKNPCLGKKYCACALIVLHPGYCSNSGVVVISLLNTYISYHYWSVVVSKMKLFKINQEKNLPVVEVFVISVVLVSGLEEK